MIEVKGLTKCYSDKVAVGLLSFTVRPGVVTGFSDKVLGRGTRTRPRALSAARSSRMSSIAVSLSA